MHEQIHVPLKKPHPNKYKYMSCLTQMDDFMFLLGMDGQWRQSQIKSFLEKLGKYYGC